MKQMTFLEPEETVLKKYTAAAGSPLYITKDRKPHIQQLRNNSKAQQLMIAINKADITPEEKVFLASASQRHTVFNYELCADYYAHATEEMQKLMEESSLVIVDIDDAIENSYVKLCKSIKRLYTEEMERNA
jgi:ribosome biogenesis GTPase A